MKFGTADIRGNINLKSLSGNTLYVGPGCTYTTITLAMAAAAANDTILVAPGTYAEAVTFTQDGLTLKSIGSKSNTIIALATTTAAGLVSMSTKIDCTIDGFTINLTAQATAEKYAVYSANASGNNCIKNCDINVTSSVGSLASLGGVNLAGAGSSEVLNCNVDVTQSSTSGVQTYGITVRSGNRSFINVRLSVSDASTGNSLVYGYFIGSTTTFTVRECSVKVESAVTTSGVVAGLVSTDDPKVHIYGTDIDVNCSSTGLAYGTFADAFGSGSALSLYNCTVKAIAVTDGDGTDYIVSDGTIHVYGGNSLGDVVSSGTVTTLGLVRIGVTSAIVA